LGGPCVCENRLGCFSGPGAANAGFGAEKSRRGFFDGKEVTPVALRELEGSAGWGPDGAWNGGTRDVAEVVAEGN